MIVLTRRLNVESYEVSMVVGRKDPKREDILSFLRLMSERYGAINAREANLDFFMEKIEDHAYGPRWLWSMYNYGYITPARERRGEDIDFQKEVFNLTPFGHEVVNNGVVYLPQSGNFVAHVTDDPLMKGMELLALVPLEEPTVGKQWNADERAMRERSATDPKSVAIPAALKGLGSGVTVELPAQGREKQLIIEIKGNAYSSKAKLDASLEIRLSPGERPMMALVQEGGRRVALDLPCPLTYEIVVSEAAKAAKLELDNDLQSVLVSLDEVGDKELHTMRRELPDLGLEFPGLGEFTAKFTEDLPLRPRSLGDASRWASRLMLEELDDYVTKDGYGALVARYAERFASWYGVDDVARNMPSFKEVLYVVEEYARRGDQRRWFFQAPIDLDGGVFE